MSPVGQSHLSLKLSVDVCPQFGCGSKAPTPPARPLWSWLLGQQVPSPVVTVHTSPRLNFTPRGVSGWGGGMCARISFSTRSSTMQASPRKASPTLWTEGRSAPDSAARARGMLWLSSPSIEIGSLCTAEAVLDLQSSCLCIPNARTTIESTALSGSCYCKSPSALSTFS